jgi:predicted ATP-grasp superfamily ATP-dependent carboligase
MNAEMFRFITQPQLENTSFVVGWTKDAGAVSGTAVNYLVEASTGSRFCQVEPVGFFPVGGVTVENDVAQFPESELSYSQAANVVVLRSDEPQTHRYEFLEGIVDFAQHYARTATLYTINGLPALIPHTATRRVFGVYNGPAVQTKLRPLVSAGMTWQGMPHLSTHLLWLARSQGLAGAGLWVEVPFYLTDYQDLWAVKSAVSLLGIILGQHWELDKLDRFIDEEDEKFGRLRKEDRDIDAKIRNLEEGHSLDRQEQMELAEAVQNALRGGR